MSSPRRSPAAGSTPTMKVVGRPISVHLVTRSLRIWSVVGASVAAFTGERKGAAATGGRTAAAADSGGGRLGWKRAARRTAASRSLETSITPRTRRVAWSEDPGSPKIWRGATPKTPPAGKDGDLRH